MKYSLFEFNVEVNDVITPSSCSTMVIEFIKYLIYQKQLIPYPYERLKMYVDKRKKHLESNQEERQNRKLRLISEKHFKKTEQAYNSLENIFRVITEELTPSTNHDRVEEIVLFLGTSFLNPEEVFRLCIPPLDFAHLLKFHSTKKNCRNLFRAMFKSEQFHSAISNKNCTGSLHVMLKMKSNTYVTSQSFISRAGFNLPNKGNHTRISFSSDNSSSNCSCDFNVFEDSDIGSQSSQTMPGCDCESTTGEIPSSFSTCIWYQMKHTLRHLTEVQFDGIAITDLWMNPALIQKNS